ncbi:DUF1932 domain-containing protein [Sphingomonas nostoxanthinifaciens]|uniref:DUF1932 domain-containing protein n=1 Tax=Sphingomonas nostoxanthinifaciens TaxID=2872652 RepID=UPI001CC21D79|nr:NAD(P)-dependent oxidoreductase [Sphingomonas nostoxanthinifaciens]UAK23552.1 DUF1932 domain-containing protein [Sphingomonas nostoxanthinifaciens]
MGETVVLIGFGEAGAAFAAGLIAAAATVSAYDRKTDDPATAGAKWADYGAAGIAGAASMAEALHAGRAVLSLVTADQAVAAASAAAPAIAPDALWFDMNSVGPDTKRAAAQAIEAAGGRYVDVAVMSPVLPARIAAPLLLSGPHAEAGAAMLGAIGFTRASVVPGPVGRASSIKMIRSVMVKGIEALTAECVLAADAAGVLDEVLVSLDASPPPPSWAARSDYNLDRMMVHGLRRAAEMEEVVKTLDALGTGSAMTRATVGRQRAIGEGGFVRPPAGLDEKLALLASRTGEAQAA